MRRIYSGDVPIPDTPLAFRLSVEFDAGGAPCGVQFSMGTGEGESWTRLPDHAPFRLGPGALVELDRHGGAAGADPLAWLGKMFGPEAPRG